MCCSATNIREIHYGMVRAYINVAYKALDTLECWYKWGSRVEIEIVDGVH